MECGDVLVLGHEPCVLPRRPRGLLLLLLLILVLLLLVMVQDCCGLTADQGLTLVPFSAQLEPFLTQNTPQTPPKTSEHLLNTPLSNP